MIKENFIKIYEESFKENWALPALTDYGKSKTFTFGDVATEIARIHLLFHECQVRRGDKIALIGKDSSRWCIAYMAVVTYGAIIVPILQDFNPNDVHHIINHSESVFLFVSDRIWDSLEEDKIEEVRGVFSLSDYRCLHQRDGENIQKLMKSLDEKMTEKYPEVDFVYPMHLNPNVRKPIHEVFGKDLSDLDNMFFIEPLEYLVFVSLMEKSSIVLTDSGGIQEEAPGLGKPVLVMRNTTERPEALDAGTVKLVGTDYDKIVGEVSRLLDDETYYNQMSHAVNPYGDGLACERIVSTFI